MNTNKAVKLAFPKLKPQTRQIIADWYDNEDAGDDFDNLRDYAEHIKSDLMDMIWAATDATEVKAVKDDLVACGYYNADQFPEDEESEDVAVPDPEDDEKKAIRIAKREGLTPKQIELFVQMRRAWANIKESTKITLTFAQLKRLVKEGTAPDANQGATNQGSTDPVAAIEEDLSDILDKIDAWRTDGSMEHWQYAQLFDLADDALAKLDEVKKPEAVKEDAPEAGSDDEFKKAVAELLYVADEVLGWASNSDAEIVDDQYCKKFMSIWDKVAKFVKPQPPEGK